MGLMTFLRNKAGYVLVALIGFAIIAFLIGDVVRTGSPLWGESRTVVGTVDGVEIRADEFDQKVNQSSQQYRSQGNTNLDPGTKASMVENVWNAEVANVLMNKEYSRLGLSISTEELFDLLQGKNPSALVRQSFTDPKTGVFDRNAVIMSLKERSKNAQLNSQWAMLESEVQNQALRMKYINLIKNSVYVTNLEATDDFVNRNKAATLSK